MGEFLVTAYRCERCGHQWVPRMAERPVICPRCKSARWDRPKVEKPVVAN
jgi:predicted Zn-ribbon and HTH transcriptional regulator